MPCDIYPGFVRFVDRARREVRVEIPPFTDGASIWPKADINYPIGDDSKNTEIRIVEGLPVNISFHNGDPRYPVIMGFRNPHVENEVGWRRWNHDNIECNADEVVNINAGKTINLTAGETINLSAKTINVTGDTAINLVTGSTSIKLTAGQIQQIATILTMKGLVVHTGADMTSNGISVPYHTHIEQGDGKPVSLPV